MRLVANNGALAGTALVVSDGLTIPPCCDIRASADGFEVHSLDRAAPVFVNGLPVTTRRLRAHDELRIGDSLFIVHDDEPAAASALAPCPVTVERIANARPVLEVSVDEAL